METIRITFKTITPLWTGDAWGENREIRPSSLLGSLRFWFYVYSKSIGISTEKINSKGLIDDNINEYLNEYNKKHKTKETLNSLILGKIKILSENHKSENLTDKAIKTVLSTDLHLPLISQIFGCTGLKGVLSIKNIHFKDYRLSKELIDFTFLYNKLENVRTKDSEFWTNKLLFKNKNEIVLFNDISFDLTIKTNYYDELLKFLSFYTNSVIITGGKKSFGFGFIKILSDADLTNVTIPEVKNELFETREIEIPPTLMAKVEDNILGFNLKHYQRLKEKHRFRKTNFGEQSKASKFFFSTYLIDNKNKIYLIGFNEYKKGFFSSLMDKYSRFED